MPGAALIQLNRFGDLHQTLPVLNGLCERYGAHNVVLVCCDDFAEALPPEAFLGQKAILKRATLAKWAKRLRMALKGDFPQESLQAELPICMQTSFEVTINLTHDEPSTALMALMSSKEQRGRIWSLKDDIRLTTGWSKYLFALVQNRLDNLFNLVDIQLGIAGLPHLPQSTWLTLAPESLAFAKQLLLSKGWNGQKALVAIQLGASDSFRALGPKKYAAALSVLSQNCDLQVVCLGTPAESILTDLFCEHFSGQAIRLNGFTTMAQLPAVLKHCRLLIGNDTGTLHAAASVGTPCLGVFFATAYFTETAPYGAGHVILQAALNCSPCSASKRCPEQVCRKTFLPEEMAAIAEWVFHGKTGKAPGPFKDLDLMWSRFTEAGTLLYEPVPGWSARPRYLNAMKWRALFESILLSPEQGFDQGEDGDRLKIKMNQAIPVAQAALQELADALECVADQLQEVNPISHQEGDFKPKAPSFTFASFSDAQKAMERLIRAQAQAQIWGRFIGFDLFDVSTQSPQSERDIIDSLQIRHRVWAQRTRGQGIQTSPRKDG